MTDDNLIDFQRDTFTHEGKSRTVFRQGSGPAVFEFLRSRLVAVTDV